MGIALLISATLTDIGILISESLLGAALIESILMREYEKGKNENN
jgi:hypothetical protein